ncbi:hypothetical protein MAR_032958 [Mya arenaria]|uniref:Tesmin/TSO1-like CXC domain-containing protein n=1 Tax=Mya arenaria TaxID=6604 RepID=A0ABY7GGX7_MYAAR|nr:hypothetical protein MAR_032958 [Mya arenaria]
MGNAVLNPLDFGWIIVDGLMMPVRTSLPPAPENLLKIIRCNCIANCDSKKCTCRKHSLECSSGCCDCKDELTFFNKVGGHKPIYLSLYGSHNLISTFEMSKHTRFNYTDFMKKTAIATERDFEQVKVHIKSVQTDYWSDTR